MKTQKVIGILALVLFLLAYFSKLKHIPGAGVELLLSSVLFAFVYFPLQLVNDFRQAEHRFIRLYYLLRFLTFFVIVLGFCFVLQHWRGAFLLLKLSRYFLPLYILFYLYKRWKFTPQLRLSQSDLIVVVISFFIYSFVEQIRVPSRTLHAFLGQEQQAEALRQGIDAGNALIYQKIEHLSGQEEMMEIKQAAKQIKQEADSLQQYLSRFKEVLILQVQGLTPEQLPAYPRRYLAENFSIEDCENYLFRGSAEEVLPFTVYEMQQRISAYVGELQTALDSVGLVSVNMGLGLETDPVISFAGEEVSWESYMFQDKVLVSALANISYLQQLASLNEHNALNLLLLKKDLPEQNMLLVELANKQARLAVADNRSEFNQLRQKEAMHKLELEKANAELQQQTSFTIFAVLGVLFTIVLLVVSNRAFARKKRDNEKLAEQAIEIADQLEELNQQNDEIIAQRDEIEAQRDLVSQQKSQIERTHLETTQSIDYAERIQTMLLPAPALLEEKFAEHFVLLLPKDKVSGDFYWWSHVEGYTVVTAADCTGHGVPGAFMSMLGISFLREIVQKEYITHPGVILRKMRKEIMRSLNQDGRVGEQKDGMDMALVSIHEESLVCQYAGAYNPLYLIRDGELLETKADKMPIAIHQRMDAFTCHEIQLEKGDILYMFSDGFADQFGGELGKKYKYKPFKEFLLAHADKPLKEQKELLFEEFNAWKGELEQVDDVVVLALKI